MICIRASLLVPISATRRYSLFERFCGNAPSITFLSTEMDLPGAFVVAMLPISASRRLVWHHSANALLDLGWM